MDSFVNTMMHAVRGTCASRTSTASARPTRGCTRDCPRVHRDESRIQGLDRLGLPCRRAKRDSSRVVQAKATPSMSRSWWSRMWQWTRGTINCKLKGGDILRSMNTGSVGLERGARRRSQGPRSVPWAVAGELDVVAVDTTWGELQPLQCAPDVQTLGELEVLELVQQGAVLIDTRVSGSSNGVTLPGARSLPHDQAVQRRGELDSSRVSILFCNGPQCPQSPLAIRALLEAGISADSLAYYRGGVHDWVTLAMPTEATS